MLKKWIGILVAAVVVAAAPVCAKSTYHHPASEINITYPDDWVLKTPDSRNVISLSHNSTPSSVNVYMYTFEPAVTANRLQQMRATSNYDGWLNLMERAGSPYETKRANADDSYIAVYSNPILDENLEVQKHFIGEYYYIKGNRAYVITIATYQDLWPRIQPSAKLMLDSFWVGSGFRPIVEKEEKEYSGWLISGVNAKNQNYMDTLLPLTATASAKWQLGIPLQPNKARTFETLLLADNKVLALINDTMYAWDVVSGTNVWRVDFSGKIIRDPVIYDHIVYFIREKDGQTELIGLHSENGSTLFTMPLDTSQLGQPVVHKNQLLLSKDNRLVNLLMDSGQTQWQVDDRLNMSFRPVLSDSLIVTVLENGSLKARQLSTGQEKWHREISGRISQPVLVKDLILVSGRSILENEPFVLALDQQTGERKWTFNTRTRDLQIQFTPAADDETVVIPLVTTQSPGKAPFQVILAVDAGTGALKWQQNIERSDRLKPIRPVITDNGILVTGRLNGADSLIALDPKTGTPQPLVLESTYFYQKDATLESFKLFNQNLVLVYNTKGKEVVELVR